VVRLGAAVVLTAALAAAALGAACGALAPGPPAVTPTPAPAAVVTEGDNGHTVLLAVGQHAALRLDNRSTWSEPQVSGSAVRIAPAPTHQGAAYREWTVSAAARGRATIVSEARPRCSPGLMCPGAIVAYSVTFEVT
jgi:hypothetical protein